MKLIKLSQQCRIDIYKKSTILFLDCLGLETMLN